MADGNEIMGTGIAEQKVALDVTPERWQKIKDIFQVALSAPPANDPRS